LAQWDVYQNPSPRARAEIPFVVDVQSGLLAGLRTRFVVPLAADDLKPAGLPKRLTPRFKIGGRAVRLVPHEAGSVDATVLRKPLATLRDDRRRITDALDTVISGV